MALNIEATDFGRSDRRCVDVFRAPHVVDVAKAQACSIRIRRGSSRTRFSKGLAELR